MQTITYRGKQLTVPAYLDELTPELYRLQLMLSTAMRSGLVDLDTYRRQMLGALAGVPGGDYSILLPEIIAELDAQLVDATDRLLDHSGDAPVPCLRTCRNLLPEVDGHNGPGDWLSGLTWGEFVEAATALDMASTAEDPNDELVHVARVLYHYGPDDEVPLILAHHAPLLLGNALAAMSTSPVTVNGRELDLSIIFRAVGPTRKPDDRTGWTGITFEVAAAGLFGTVKDVEKADVWEVLIYLYHCKWDIMHDPNLQKSK